MAVTVPIVKKKLRLNLEGFTLPKEIEIEANNVHDLRTKVSKECLRLIEEQIRKITFDVEDKQMYGIELHKAMYIEINNKMYRGFGQFFNPSLQRKPLPIPEQYVSYAENNCTTCIDQLNKVVTDGIPYERLKLLTVEDLPDTYYATALSAFNQVREVNKYQLRHTLGKNITIKYPIKDEHLTKLTPAGKFRVLEFLEGLIGYQKSNKNSFYKSEYHGKNIFGITENEFEKIIFNLSFDSKYTNDIANIKKWYKEEIQ